jgi:hypothetical protein
LRIVVRGVIFRPNKNARPLKSTISSRVRDEQRSFDFMKKMNSVICKVLIFTQAAGSASFARADLQQGATTPNSGAEVRLLETLIASSGTNVDRDDMKKTLVNALSEYDQAAPSEGRPERMTQALVYMNVMTTAQATDFREGLDRDLSQQISDGSNTDSTQASKVIGDAVAQKLQNLPGAQFSGCSAPFVLGGFAALAAAGVLFYEWHVQSAGNYSDTYEQGGKTVSVSVQNGYGALIGGIFTVVGAGALLIMGGMRTEYYGRCSF